MSEGFWTGVILTSLIAGGVYYANIDKQPKQPELNIGRYELISNGDQPSFLLDTATGDTWRWVHIKSNYKKEYGAPETIDYMWEQQRRFTAKLDENEYVRSVLEFDKAVNAPQKN